MTVLARTSSYITGAYIALEGFGMKRSWPNWGTILAFAWRDWGKSRKPSFGIAVMPAEIQTEHHQIKVWSITSRQMCSVKTLPEYWLTPVYHIARCHILEERSFSIDGHEHFVSGSWMFTSCVSCISHCVSCVNSVAMDDVRLCQFAGGGKKPSRPILRY